MKSTLIMIVISAVFICVGWLAGGILLPVFTGVGAVFATLSFIISFSRKDREINE